LDRSNTVFASSRTCVSNFFFRTNSESTHPSLTLPLISPRLQDTSLELGQCVVARIVATRTGTWNERGSSYIIQAKQSIINTIVSHPGIGTHMFPPHLLSWQGHHQDVQPRFTNDHIDQILKTLRNVETVAGCHPVMASAETGAPIALATSTCWSS
jgi:hypothetical protein